VSSQDDYELWTVRPDGSALTRLTFSPGGDVSPSWSPDGSLIAFSSYRDGGGGQEIYTIAPDGSGTRRLTHTAATESDLSWSPDGRNLVYQTNRYGTESIEVLSLRDGSVRRVVPPVNGDHDPVWSSDGRWILFVRIEADGYEIYKVHPNGRGLTNLTKNSFYDSAATWSPDSSRIAFMTNRDAPASAQGNEIYVMRADGSRQRRITFNSVRDFEPGWSPNGKLISVHAGVFGLNNDMGDDDIVIMRTNGSGRTRLTFTPGNDQAAEWEPVPKPCINRLPPPRGRRVTGTLFGDTFGGRSRSERILGRLGDDCLAGAGGPDFLDAGPGRDSVDARDSERDLVDCGPGRDTARLDSLDVARACERRARR
jgi:Tol biopolymer transport system component